MMYSNLFIARREKRLTQEETAKLIGLSKQSYYLKETGKVDFKLEEAKVLAKYFGKSVDELFSN